MVTTRSRSRVEKEKQSNSNITPHSKSIKNSMMKVQELEEELRIAREKLTIFRRPFSVLYHFSVVFGRFMKWLGVYIATHRVTQFILTPALILWIVASNVEGAHHEYLDEFNLNVEFIIWWVGLGILSSVGFGTGMHSGILFLFPHIFLVVQGAEQCNSLNFDSRQNIWFRAFETECVDEDERTIVTFFSIFQKVFIPCMLWGAGTAIGEIPPYAVSKAAAIAGKKDEEFEDVTGSRSQFDVLNRMKDWMILFLKNHGFFGVLLMAAWPNMAFDLCGICCGHFLMPFWTFFGATFVGKALIKVHLQSMFFITIFMDSHLRHLESVIAGVTPSSWKLESKVNDFLLECRRKFHKDHSHARTIQDGVVSESIISRIGGILMTMLIIWYAISCIEQFAKHHAEEEDTQRIEKLKANINKKK